MTVMTVITDKIAEVGKSERGFTLLEVLIALLVLAIGLLGLAALQTTGLRSNTMATSRTHATQLTYDISDRMRANVAGSYNTDPNNVVQNTVDGYGMASCPNPLPDPLPDAPALPDPLALADYDLNRWCSAVVGMLPSGDARIKQTIELGNDATLNTADDVVTYEVTIYWDETHTGAFKKGCVVDATNGQVDYPNKEDDLRCIQLNVTIPRPIPNA
jgi:type IV pilus assembly protein PilV